MDVGIKVNLSLQEPTIDQAKGRIDEYITRYGFVPVVMIDDIDRGKDEYGRPPFQEAASFSPPSPKVEATQNVSLTAS